MHVWDNLGYLKYALAGALILCHTYLNPKLPFRYDKVIF